MKFRIDINGLRAIAVMAVVLFHLTHRGFLVALLGWMFSL